MKNLISERAGSQNCRLRDVSISDSFENLIQTSRALRTFEYEELERIIAISNQRLAPLGEPLSQSVELHKWLLRAREETYSDWLKWLFENMSVNEAVDILGIDCWPENLLAQFQNKKVTVIRELNVEEGHEEKKGRIDLLLSLEDLAFVAIEVKKGAADDSDFKKNGGYRKSILKLNYKNPAFIMLVSSAKSNDYGGFKPRIYADFCCKLRQLSRKWIISGQNQLFKSAMLLMITSAIEINFLGLSTSKYGPKTRTISYLEKFVELTK